MEHDRRPGKLAVIVHADIAGSTALVQQDEHVAHERIRDSFRRLGEAVSRYHGSVVEVRGDALLAQFERASDAVSATLGFQAAQAGYNERLDDGVLPRVRIGVALGEVILADGTVTGSGVVLAQRVEQLAAPGGVCISGAIHEALPKRMPFEQDDLGEQVLKGFDEPVRVFRIDLVPGESPPLPGQVGSILTGKRVAVATALATVLLATGGMLLWLQPWQEREAPASEERMAFPLPDKPSIAVLPFANISDDPEQEYFVDGITNDLITDLSKFKNLFLIASNSTFSYKGKPVKVQQVAEDLGVRYVLEGSVQRAGDTLRINAQLIDALSGHHIWAERYDRDAGDLFAVQNEMLKTIVASLNFQVEEFEFERAIQRPTKDLKAHDYFTRGWAYLREKINRENNARVHEWMQKAIQADPQYARAYSTEAVAHSRDWRYSLIEDTSESLELALKNALKSVSLDPDDYWNHWGLGAVYLANGDSDEALNAYERAL